MTRETADELWGRNAVEHALAHDAPEPITEALTQDIARHAQHSRGAFRAWALAQPWPRFCAIVRVVSGVARDDLLGDD